MLQRTIFLLVIKVMMQDSIVQQCIVMKIVNENVMVIIEVKIIEVDGGQEDEDNEEEQGAITLRQEIEEDGEQQSKTMKGKYEMDDDEDVHTPCKPLLATKTYS